MQKPIFILYVSSQLRSKEFYELVLGCKPIMDVPGMTEFALGEHAVLGLMPETGIVKILGDATPDPKTGNGIPRSELYLYVSNPEEHYGRALSAGAKAISGMELRTWGDKVAYCADPDGHILAFATK